MNTRSNAPNPETEAQLSTLIERAKALDALFACGGEVHVPAPIVLRGPGRKKLEVVERDGLYATKVAQKLRAWCPPASFGDGTETRQDARVRVGRQLYARDGALAVEGFDAGLAQVLSEVREALCPHDAEPPRAELHSLNVYDPRGHFVAHKDTPRDPSVFATLVVCLPLRFSGGKLIVEQESQAIFDWETSFYSRREADDTRLRWAAFFGDVDHRIQTVTSGCRVTLTYELRRASESVRAPTSTGEAEAAFTAALVEALADPKFAPDGGKLGMPCLHLYALPTIEGPTLPLENLRDHLKGRDWKIAGAMERAGLVPRVVPYVFETCAGDAWRLRRQVNEREKKMFSQKRLRGSILEESLPAELHVDYDRPDDVTWLSRPPWKSEYGLPSDGRPKPAIDLLGDTEFSPTDYFGNEAAHVAFYATCAILFDVPPKAERKPRSRRG